MILRKNQEKPVEIGTNFFLSGNTKPSLMVEPVAFGKSIVIAHIAENIKHKGKVLCLQPTKELLEQNYEKFIALGGKASIFSASLNTKEYGDVTYATIGSIKNIGDKFRNKGYKYLIVDEADRYPRNVDSMFGKFLASSQIKSVLGLTATPFKLQTNSFNMEAYSILKMLTSRSKHGNFFKDIIHVTQIQDVIKDGYWSKLEYEEYDFDTGKLIYNSTKAEYTEDSVIKAYEDQHLEEKIVNKIRDLGEERKSIVVFVPSVAHAISLEEKIPSSIAIYGDMPKNERTIAVKNFKNQTIRVAINVNIFSIGFDYPQIDCIILGRPTSSLSLSYQQQGRGTRLHDDKDNCLIIDFVGNLQKFGKIEDLYIRKDNKWKLYGTGDRLLTDISIDTIGTVTLQSEMEEKIIIERIKEVGDVIITFGKFEGKSVSDTPQWWRNWVLKNMDNTGKTKKVIEEINRLKTL